MKIYFDVCCLNRPYDDQTQDRIHLEAEAIIGILRHIELNEWIWVSSGVVNYEISKTQNNERKGRLESMARWASEFVEVNEDIFIRAKKIQEFGIKEYDALHIACGEYGRADVFLSTDDKLLRIAEKNIKKLKIKVINPLIWLQKMVKL